MSLESQLKWFEAWVFRSQKMLGEMESIEASTRENYHRQKTIARELRADAEAASAHVLYRRGPDTDPSAKAEACQGSSAAEQEAVAAELQLGRLEAELEKATRKAHASTVTLSTAVKTTASLRTMLVRECKSPPLPPNALFHGSLQHL